MKLASGYELPAYGGILQICLAVLTVSKPRVRSDPSPTRSHHHLRRLTGAKGTTDIRTVCASPLEAAPFARGGLT